MAAHSKEISHDIQVGDFVANEIPSGDIDSVNVTFVLAHVPIIGTVLVMLNGMQQYPGTGKDYTISGKTITFLKAPKIGSEILCNYLRV